MLAAVTCGLYVSWHGPEIASPETRLQGQALWGMLGFLLNATLFVLIGLQLPVDRRRARNPVRGRLRLRGADRRDRHRSPLPWLFTMPYVIRTLDRRPGQVERRVGAGPRIVMAWSGMRGAVSLAAALALPFETDAGAELADRDLVIFIAYGVILATVVGQGLTLPALIRALGVADDGTEAEREEIHARLVAAKAALDCLDELEAEEWTRDDTIERVRGLYRFRKRRFATQAGKIEDEDGIEDRSISYQRLMHLVYDAQRSALLELRGDGRASAEVLRRVERDLDLEESRLDS